MVWSKLPACLVLASLFLVATRAVTVGVQAVSQQQPEQKYSVTYPGSSLDHVAVRLDCASIVAAGSVAPTIVFARSVPSSYSLVLYENYVSDVVAVTASGARVNATRVPDTSRWTVAKSNSSPIESSNTPRSENDDAFVAFEYEVNIAAMEAGVFSGTDSSKVRHGKYVSVLLYSVLATLLGGDASPATVTVKAPPSWPVLCTAQPSFFPNACTDVSAASFYDIADTQILMGPQLQVVQVDVPKSPVPLSVGIFSEFPELDVAMVANLTTEAMVGVVDFYGDRPVFEHYATHFEWLQPVSALHQYDFCVEHLDSATCAFDSNRVIDKGANSSVLDRHLFNFAHHIAHSWIPKRSAERGYYLHVAPRTFEWEVPYPLDTIWLAEGFTQWAAIQAIAKKLPRGGVANLTRHRFTETLHDMPACMDAMPLAVVSRAASSLYSADFRLGQSVFARGGLMAGELNDYIRKETGGKFGMREALQGLIAWSEGHKRGYDQSEVSGILSDAVGVDVSYIVSKWLQPMRR